MNSASEFVTRLGRKFRIGERKRAYQLTFRSPPGVHYVLPDLAEFCRAMEPAPADTEMFNQGRAAGRRDVWLRIQQHLNLTEEEMFAVYSGRSILQPKDFQR